DGHDEVHVVGREPVRPGGKTGNRAIETALTELHRYADGAADARVASVRRWLELRLLLKVFNQYGPAHVQRARGHRRRIDGHRPVVQAGPADGRANLHLLA